MLGVLFWNIKSRPVGDYLRLLCSEHDVDVVVLAEPGNVAALLAAINEHEPRSVYLQAYSPQDKLAILTRLPAENLRPVLDEDGLAVREVTTAIANKILLCAVHLPSKIYFKESDQALHAVEVVRKIRQAEEATSNIATLVIGDFNMNPFDHGMISANGFHAVMDRRIAVRRPRKVKGAFFPYFYNPMWEFMGSSKRGAPGTHYYPPTGYLGYHWHTLDQVLISPELLHKYKEEVDVLTSAGSQTLACKKNFRPEVSDHFPVLVKFT